MVTVVFAGFDAKIGKNARKRENDANAHVTWKINKTANFYKPPFSEHRTQRVNCWCVESEPKPFNKVQKMGKLFFKLKCKIPIFFWKFPLINFLIFVDFVFKNPSQTPSWFIQTRCYFILSTVIVLMLFLGTTYTVPLMMPFNRN